MNERISFILWFDYFQKCAADVGLPEYRVTRKTGQAYYKAGFSAEAAAFTERQRYQRVYDMVVSL